MAEAKTFVVMCMYVTYKYIKARHKDSMQKLFSVTDKHLYETVLVIKLLWKHSG